MARNEQLIRQHKLLQILERYRYGRTLKELRDELVDELGLGDGILYRTWRFLVRYVTPVAITLVLLNKMFDLF